MSNNKSATKTKKYRRGMKFGDWTLTRPIGKGGNGEVWICTDSNGNCQAIKLLKNVRDKVYQRFLDEVIILERMANVDGIIPIIDKYLPDYSTEITPFFVMPIAEASEAKLCKQPITKIIDAIIQVAETLQELHMKDIFHRDIKPANILFYNSRFQLSDFGLVDYPDKKDVSKTNENIGAKWTIAPEMERSSSTANGAKADIYSLAKTLWIYLSGDRQGFEGQYPREKKSVIHISKYHPNIYTSPLDNLLFDCTDTDPDVRPTIDQFLNQLREWEKRDKEFHARNQHQWVEIHNQLFPRVVPNRVIWNDIDDIIRVLAIASSYPGLNHTFLPGSGGMDLKDVRHSAEHDCIELDFGIVHIVKPKRLLFESFGYDHQWNYFRLEIDELKPAIIPDDDDEKCQIREDIVELFPGEYYSYSDMNAHDLNESSSYVTRWFIGTFVLFSKRSSYNLDSSTYDGRHDKMTTDEFREYIQRQVTYYQHRTTIFE